MAFTDFLRRCVRTFGLRKDAMTGEQAIRTSPLFDHAWYVRHYEPDGLDADTGAAAHYLNVGWKLGYDPSPQFSTQEYLRANRSVAKDGANPLLHYELFGRSEGRKLYTKYYGLIVESGLFDREWYERSYALPKGIDAIRHYLDTGADLGYAPSAEFSSIAYLASNLGVLRKGRNPLLHYIQHGQKEGRKIPEEKYRLPPHPSEHLGQREKEKLRALAQQQAEEARDLQDRRIVQEYSRSTKKLIVFLVPPVDATSGGSMPLCSFARVTRELSDIHGSQVIVATVPSINTFADYAMFDAGFDIYRFEQLSEYFTDLDELQIHIPEQFCRSFLIRLSAQSVVWLERIPVRRANIFNQNIQLLPTVVVIDYLKRFFTETIMTAVHRQHCSRQLRSSYDVSLHFLSIDNLVKCPQRPPNEKEPLLLYSFDRNPYKDAILDSIREKHPDLELREIENLKYEDYLDVLSRAKWMIAFREGIDGYFLESVRSGAIPFTTYKLDFFDDRFDGLPTVYRTSTDMLEKIADDIARYDAPDAFSALSKRLIEIDSVAYDNDEYRENIRQFYLGNYTLPIEEAHALQKRNFEERPLISVVMATYNGERFLEGQLASLSRLTYENIEIVISDDGSTDDTMAILWAFPFKHPVTIVTNSGTHGLVGNYNNAMSLAKGEYWALCDQDDIWCANKLETLLARIEGYDLVQGKLRAIDSDGRRHESIVMRRAYEADRSKQYHFAQFIFENPSLGCAALVRADFMREILPIPEDAMFHDWWITLNAIKRNGICYTDKEVAQYRQYGENTSHTFFHTPGYNQRLLRLNSLIMERLGDKLTEQERALLHINRNWYWLFERFSSLMPQQVRPYFRSNRHALTDGALASIQNTITQALKGEDSDTGDKVTFPFTT